MSSIQHVVSWEVRVLRHCCWRGLKGHRVTEEFAKIQPPFILRWGQLWLIQSHMQPWITEKRPDPTVTVCERVCVLMRVCGFCSREDGGARGTIKAFNMSSDHMNTWALWRADVYLRSIWAQRDYSTLLSAVIYFCTAPVNILLLLLFGLPVVEVGVWLSSFEASWHQSSQSSEDDDEDDDEVKSASCALLRLFIKAIMKHLNM